MRVVESLLSVEGLVRRFAGRTAVAGLRLELEPGEVLGLIGANGCGKTTSLRMLAGITRPDAGTGHVLGCDVRREAAAIRRRVGYMAQRLSLYAELSVLENLRFRAEVNGLSEPRRRAAAAAAELGLGGRLHERAGRLSGGFLRRLQLAAALIHAPRLVLLDEPTAGLDVLARREVWQRVHDLAAAGAGVVVASHDLTEAERCTSIALLAAGRVVAAGPPRDVARRAPALAVVAEADDLPRLAAALAALPAVIACDREGDRLRVVARSAAADAASICAEIERVARACGGRLWPIEIRLEDAVLAHFGATA